MGVGRGKGRISGFHTSLEAGNRPFYFKKIAFNKSGTGPLSRAQTVAWTNESIPLRKQAQKKQRSGKNFTR